MEGRVLGDGGVIPVDPTATDVEVGLAAAGGRARGRVHNCGVQGVVTDQRDHLVAVLVQFGQYVGSDESCRAGQCTFVAGASSLWVMEAGPVPGSPPGG